MKVSQTDDITKAYKRTEYWISEQHYEPGEKLNTCTNYDWSVDAKMRENIFIRSDLQIYSRAYFTRPSGCIINPSNQRSIPLSLQRGGGYNRLP